MEADEAPSRMEEGNSERHVLDRKISVMRERFMVLQQAEKELDDGDVADDTPPPNQATPKENLAAIRWNKVRMVVRSHGSAKMMQSPQSTQDLDGTDSAKFASVSSSGKRKGLELEDIMLQDNWSEGAAVQSFLIDETHLPALQLPETSELTDTSFVNASEPLKLEVSRIPEEVVTRRKDAVEQQALLEHRRALDNIKNSQVDVIWREHLARKRVMAMESSVKTNQLKEREKIVKLAMEKEQALGRDFRRAREELEAGIRRQQAAVKEDFGSLLIHEESLARRFQVYYNMFPQPMEFRIHLLRAVKNKLPKGAYVMMLTQYDRLGGYPLTWSTLGANGIGNLRPGITKIVKHHGRFFDRILRFEDSCFALCPPRPLLKPGFIFVLELFQLANFRNPEDRIVAWTALPMSFESMSLIEGKFKLPMLRGEHSSQIQHFRVMEQDIARDLDQWLCNVYFEVRQVPLKELGATNEMLKATKFDLDYFNKIIVPDSKVDAAQKASSDPNAALQRSLLAPSHVLLQSKKTPVDQLPALGVDKGIFRRKVAVTGQPSASHEDSTARSPIFRAGDIETGMNDSTHSAFNNHKNDDLPPSSQSRGWISWLTTWMGGSAAVAPVPSKHSSEVVLQKEESFLEHRKELVRRWKENIKNKVPHAATNEGAPESSTQVRERGYNLQDEVFLHPQQRGKLAGVESIDNHENRHWSAAGLEGKLVRKWHADGARFDSDAIDDGQGSPFQSPSPKPHVKGSGSVFFPAKAADQDEYQWEELRDIREMQEYNMAVASDPTRRKHVMPGAIARSKLRYLSLELFGDLVPFLFGTFEFYSTLFLYMFALWMRIYVHYLAQYLYLLAAGTPVYGFRLRVLMITFKYMSAAISTSTEVGVVAIGPIANISVFLFLVVFGHLFYQYSGFLPDVFSKFFAYFGVATILDPLLVAVVDLIYHNYDCSSTSDACKEDYTSGECDCFNGDFVKLWYRMERIEGSGLTGLVIVTMLYLACGVLTLLIMYEYLLNIHRDGRILDIWRRVNAPAEEFFVPDDFEISAAELQDIIARAKNWKGPQKARRRVFIQEGRETDPFHKGFQKTYKRYIIYESSIDGKTTSIHRQFLLDDDGKILEIFADFKKKDEQQRAFNLHAAVAKSGNAKAEGETTAEGDSSPAGGHSNDYPDSAAEEEDGSEEGGNGNDEEDEEEDNYDVRDDEEEEQGGADAGNVHRSSKGNQAHGDRQRAL